MDHFKVINEKKGLTEEDRKQIRKFHLESFITPEARKLLQNHFPEHFPAEKLAIDTLRNAEASQAASRHDSMCRIKLVLIPHPPKLSCFHWVEPYSFARPQVDETTPARSELFTIFSEISNPNEHV
jgi:hypothetical protein